MRNLAALKELRGAISLPLWFKPNAGLPATNSMGDLHYDLTPEMMAAPVPEWAAAGASCDGWLLRNQPAAPGGDARA
jgi:5-methyltetrahydrofolate--homocysteine methyltransferase